MVLKIANMANKIKHAMQREDALLSADAEKDPDDDGVKNDGEYDLQNRNYICYCCDVTVIYPEKQWQCLCTLVMVKLLHKIRYDYNYLTDFNALECVYYLK
jgi:hypothetical protein